MNATTAYLAGLLTELPPLIVQVLIARAAARRWPRFRKFAWAVLACLLAPEILRVPGLAGRVRPADWFSYWLAIWLYGSFAGYACYRLVQWLGTRRLNHTPDAGRRSIVKAAAWSAAAAPFVVAGYGTFIERLRFRVDEVTVPINELPQDLDGLQILLVSDIHRSAFLSAGELARVIDAGRGLRPDLVLHGGDFISGPHDPLDECIHQAARLKGPAGAYACLGNHEVYAKVEALATAIAARTGIDVLRYESRLLRFGNAWLNLVGVDYQRMGQRSRYLRGVEKLVVPGVTNVLLSHNPDVFPVSARMGFDLTLSGHTHGGQVKVEILNQEIDPARMYTPFVAGLYERDGRKCYVTRGVGTVGAPVRLGAPPEISLIRLARA